MTKVARSPEEEGAAGAPPAPAPAADGDDRGQWWLLVGTAGALVGGGLAWLVGAADVAAWTWGVATAAITARLAVAIVGDLRHGRAGVDIIALLAMAGALALGEYLAGAVIAVMLTGGQWLEEHAAGRARRELRDLLARAPRTAHVVAGADVRSVPVDEVAPGDVVLVRTGEVAPVDGVVADGRAVLDESALTGETRPVTRATHERVASGAVNAGPPVRLRATATAADSTYAGIVRLVRDAAADRAPFSRLADRYAIAFVPLTLIVAGAAWIASADPVRALAVLVVATPCPLILAAPIALVSGVSRAARRGIIVKGAGALEQLAGAEVVVFDKTGTLTTGRPRVADVVAAAGHHPDDVLGAAASLEQASAHVFAPAVVAAAAHRGLPLHFPTDVVERAGAGITGTVDGGEVELRGPDRDDVADPAVEGACRRADLDGTSVLAVVLGGELAGVLLLDDPLRPEAGRVVRGLRRAGVARVVMLTGDDEAVAWTVGTALGLDDVRAGASPRDKITAVRALAADATTVMVGDGVNDAPALAGADLGVAMGARGATASSEAADVVVTVDRLDRLLEAVAVSRRSRGIAVQSVLAGMGLSLVAMGFAAAGLLAPVAGALLQEAIDVAAILNALRALVTPRTATRVSAADREVAAVFRREHATVLRAVEQVRGVADRLDRLPTDAARAELRAVRQALIDEVLPHERREEERAYPLLVAAGGHADPTGPLVATHREIERMVALLDRHVDALDADGPGPGDRLELRRLLYGIHAILRLHVAQEEDAYLQLDDGA